MTDRPRRFAPTHEITLERHDGTREVIPIQLVDGVGYTRVEWVSETAADWEFSDGTWIWQGTACPPGYVNCWVRRLGRGSDPRGPSKATKRIFCGRAEWEGMPARVQFLLSDGAGLQSSAPRSHRV